MKRTFEGTEMAAKRPCTEAPHGLKRSSEAEMEDSNKRQYTERLHIENKMNQLRVENARLRASMDERDRVILYGSDEIRRLNADMFTLNQQMRIMHEYVANMEGRAVDMHVLAY